MKKNISLILIVFLLVSCTSIESDIEETVETTSTTTSIETTSTTLKPSQERAKEIDIDRSERRGVLRKSPAMYISTIYKYDSYFTNETYSPVHDKVEEFSYSINYPSFIDEVNCKDVVEGDILSLIETQVEYKKSALEYYPSDEDEMPFNEILNISYDVIEVSDEILSILFYLYNYNTGAAHGYTEPYSLNYLLYDCSKIDIPNDVLDISTEENKVKVTQEMKLQLCAPEISADECLGNDPLATIATDEWFTSSFSGVFNISKNGLYYQFAPYGASSYGEGMELILLPWSRLGDVVVETGKYSSLLYSFTKLTPYDNLEFEPDWEFKGQSTLHLGLYDFYNFGETYKFEQDRYFKVYTQTVGLESGEYLYKDTWWDAPEYVYDALVQEWCLEDGFTQEECDNTATYTWENPNIFEGIEFKDYTFKCVDEMNEKITEINNSYFERAEYYGNPSPKYRGSQRLSYYVPQLFVTGPQDYLTILELGYDDGGGTLRYPYTNPYTINLDTCEFENITDNYVVTKERMEELVLEYVQVGNDVNPNGYVVEEYLFSEEYLLGNIFFTTDTLYTILWDCFICTDSYLTLKDAPLNQANPYIVAIPLYEFKVKGS